MLRQSIIFILVILGVLAQMSIISVLPFFGHINIILLFLIYLVLLKNPFVIFFAFFCGFILDIYSSVSFGLNIITYTTIAFALIFIYLNFVSSSRIIPIILSFIGICLYYLLVNLSIVTLAFLKIIPKIEIWNKIIFVDILTEFLYTAIFVAITYVIVNFFKNRLTTLFIGGSFIKK